MNKYILIFISIYALAFTIVLWYGLNHVPVNDGAYEYRAYLDNINEGWKFRYTLVNSSLITTYLPALLHNWFGIDKMFIFRFIPALFYPLMPAFAYLIAKRYLKLSHAIVASFVVICSSYFIFFPDMGRVGVSIGFLAGMIWALLEKRLWWAIVFGGLVVFSHYATSLISFGIVGLVLIVHLILKRKLLKQYLVMSCVLLILIGLWHFGIAGYSGGVMYTKLFQAEQLDYPKDYENDKIISALIDPTTREQQVQDALLINSDKMSTPKIIEIASNYIVVIMITLGIILMFKKKEIDLPYKIMATGLYGLIVFSVAIPWVSVYYGAIRVFFTSTILLATCFMFGVERISKIVKTPIILIGILVLILYASSTSGLIYKPFGLEKTFPVVVTINEK